MESSGAGGDSFSSLYAEFQCSYLWGTQQAAFQLVQSYPDYYCIYVISSLIFIPTVNEPVISYFTDVFKGPGNRFDSPFTFNFLSIDDTSRTRKFNLLYFGVDL